MSTLISDILQNEFLYKNLDINKADVAKQLNDSVARQWYVSNGDGSYALPSDHLSLQYHHFFKNLSQSYIDAYLIVGLTLNAMRERGSVMEQRQLANEIHIAVQEIYLKGGIRFMSSCIIEILNTSIGRFSQLGVC